MTGPHGLNNALKRFWIAFRIGRRTIGWWPFDPQISFTTDEERRDQLAFGFLIGMDDKA
jgi:hypothetical protein